MLHAKASSRATGSTVMALSRSGDFKTAMWVVLLAVAADYAGVGMMRVILPFRANQLASSSGWGTATLIGALETAYGVGQLAGASFMGRVSDIFGRRAVLLTSFTGSAVGYGMTAVAASPS